MLELLYKWRFIIAILLMGSVLSGCLISPSAMVGTEDGDYDQAEIQALLLTLQNKDGGFADQIVPDLRNQLYDSYYTIKTLELLKYDLNPLQSTREWVAQINIQNDILNRDDCVIDLLLYVVGLYDSFEMKLSPDDYEALLKLFGRLQSDEGYFYGTVSQKEHDVAGKNYEDSSILTASHTICTIMTILDAKPPFMEKMQDFNRKMLENMEELHTTLNPEIDLVALKIDQALNKDGKKTFALSPETMGDLKEMLEIQSENRDFNIFTLDFLNAFKQLTNIESEEIQSRIINEVDKLRLTGGGFSVNNAGMINAQANYVGIKMLIDNNVALTDAFSSDTRQYLLEKLYYEGYFSFTETPSSCYSTFYAKKALDIVHNEDPVLRNAIKKYSESKLEDLQKNLGMPIQEKIFALLLASECDVAISSKALLEEVRKLDSDIENLSPEMQLMTLNYLREILTNFQLAPPQEWQVQVTQWLKTYSNTKKSLEGAEKIMQECYLYAVSEFFVESSAEKDRALGQLKHAISESADVLEDKNWENSIFTCDVLNFFGENEMPITFINHLPSLDTMWRVVQPDFSVKYSTQLLYNLLLYDDYTLPTEDLVGRENEAVVTEPAKHGQILVDSASVMIEAMPLNIEKYRDAYSSTTLVKSQQISQTEVLTNAQITAINSYLEHERKGQGANHAFITEGGYTEFNQLRQWNEGMYGLRLSGKWYHADDILMLCPDRIIEAYNYGAQNDKLIVIYQAIVFDVKGGLNIQVYSEGYAINNHDQTRLRKQSDECENADGVQIIEHYPVICQTGSFGFIQGAQYEIGLYCGYNGNYIMGAAKEIWTR